MKNSHAFIQISHQYRLLLNVWINITEDHLIGSEIFLNQLLDAAYMNFLVNTLSQLLEYMPLAENYQYDICMMELQLILCII